MKGVSLLETLIVVATIGFLSTIGVNTFINFRNDTAIDNIANELISDIRLARSKSMNGELLEGETVDEFTDVGLPEYGIKISETDYQIVRRCEKDGGGGDCSGEIIDSTTIDPEYILSPEITFHFGRITGTSSAQLITVEQKDGRYGRGISLSDDFIITLTEN